MISNKVINTEQKINTKLWKIYICKQFFAKTNMHTLWCTDVAVINPDSQTSRKKNLLQKILIDKVCEQIV